MKGPFKTFSAKDWCVYLLSVIIVVCSNVFAVEKDVLNLISTLVGATSLIFIAKGHFAGQIVMIVFAVLYSLVSYRNGYYGEIIICGLMTLPLSIFSIVTWVKNPYKKGENVVKAYVLNKKDILIVAVFSFLVLVGGYVILRLLNTSSIVVSTISLVTSFVASYLMFRRNSYYAVAYMVNDIVLITLWTISCFSDPTNVSIVACFAMFFINDLYAFVSWKIREKQQLNNTKEPK